MLGKKILTVFVALAIVGQVSVFAQDSALGTGGLREIPVSGSELQRQATGKADVAGDSFEKTGKANGSDLAHLGGVMRSEDVSPPRIIPNLLFTGLIFWLGMKFAQYRIRANQQLIRK